jgi:hypothetical protein
MDNLNLAVPKRFQIEVLSYSSKPVTRYAFSVALKVFAPLDKTQSVTGCLGQLLLSSFFTALGGVTVTLGSKSMMLSENNNKTLTLDLLVFKLDRFLNSTV